MTRTQMSNMEFALTFAGFVNLFTVQENLQENAPAGSGELSKSKYET